MHILNTKVTSFNLRKNTNNRTNFHLTFSARIQKTVYVKNQNQGDSVGETGLSNVPGVASELSGDLTFLNLSRSLMLK